MLSNMPNDFIDDYQDKKPIVVKKCFDTGGLTWGKINKIVERNNINSDEFKMAYQGIVEKHHYIEQYDDVGSTRYRLIKPIVYDLLKQGATLIANRIINEPAIDGFSRQIAQLTGRQTVASMYVAFGDKDSYKAHWDTVMYLQFKLKGVSVGQ